MKLKDYKFLFILLFSINSLLAQELVFKVLDQKTNEPLELVNIFKNKTEFLGFTNKKGEIIIKSSGEQGILSFQLLGYKTISLNIKEAPSVIKMETLLEELSAVIIAAKKKESYELTQLKPVEGTHIYAGKKSEVINLDLVVANKATNNARQIYAKVAGLNIYDNGDGGLQLNIGGRGLDPNRTANFNTRQNDYDISADVLGYPESYYTPPSEALHQIQVIRGAASLQYGTQFGGLINFKLKKPNKKKLLELITRNTIGSFGEVSNYTSLSGTSGDLGYLVYGNFKKGDGFRPNSEYNSRNLYAYLDYNFNDKTTLSVEATNFYYLAKQPGGLSDVQFLQDPFQSNSTRNWFSVNWSLFNLKLNHQFSENVKSSLSLFALDASRKAIGFRGLTDNPFANDNQDPNTGVFQKERDLIVGTFKNYGAEARVITEYDLGLNKSVLLLGSKFYKANNTARQGAGSIDTDADFTFRNEEFEEYPNQSNFDFPNSNISVFGENIFNITDHFSITPGFRFEYIKTETDGVYTDISASFPVSIPESKILERQFVLLGVGLSYKPKPYFESYFNFSENYRSITFSDIRTVSPSFVIDPNIKDESGYTLDIGVRGKFKKSLSYDFSVYSLLYDNRIGQRFSTERPFRAQFVRGNIGQATIIGFESLIQWNIKETFFNKNENLHLNVFTNLALTNSEYTSSDETNIEGNQVEFVPEVNLKTGVTFGYKNLLSSLQYTYLSEQFTDATNSPYNPNNNTSIDGAIPSYDILDLSISYKFNKNFKLETGVNNLLNNTYFTRRATGYPGPGIIPSAPRSYYATLEIKI